MNKHVSDLCTLISKQICDNVKTIAMPFAKY